MTDTDNVEQVGFDFESWVNTQTSSGGVYGEFQQAVITPGFYSFATGIDYDKRFVPVQVGKPNAQKAAQSAVLQLGDKYTIGYSLLLKKGTRINENEEYKQEEDYEYTFKKSMENVNGSWQDTFDWTLWFDSVNEHVPASWYGKPIWVHIASKRHPRLDLEDETTFDYDTVKYRDGVIVRDEEGHPKPRYHKYVAAAFLTKEELVEYALANGLELEGVEPTVSLPVPDGWALPVDQWSENANHIVAEISGSNLPKKAVVSKLMNDGWGSTGLTEEDLNSIYDTVKATPNF